MDLSNYEAFHWMKNHHRILFTLSKNTQNCAPAFGGLRAGSVEEREKGVKIFEPWPHENLSC